MKGGIASECLTLADVLRRIPYFVEDGDNQKRLHSAPGYWPHADDAALISATDFILLFSIGLTLVMLL